MARGKKSGRDKEVDAAFEGETTHHGTTRPRDGKEAPTTLIPQPLQS